MCDNPRDQTGIRLPVGGGNSYKSYVSDSGQACSGCSLELPNGNAASTFWSYPSEACPDGWEICSAPAGLTSWSSDGTTWETFAHEIGHNFNAPHTGSGIMGASGGSPVFYDDGCLSLLNRTVV